MKTEQATNEVFLDLETFGDSKPSPEDIKAPSNYKSAGAIEKYQKANVDREWRKQALSSTSGRILCIGIALNNEDPVCLYNDNERELMKSFEDWIKTLSWPVFIGHNIKKFDALFLFHKALKYSLPGIASAFSDSKGRGLADTMDMMAGPAWGEKTSLDNAGLLLFNQGKGAVSGKDVHDMYLDGKIEEICDYCKDDVLLTRKIYRHLTSLGVSPK